MDDETSLGSFEASDGRRHPGGGQGQPAPLQSRANFLENWSWASVTQINRGLCERGGAQRGINSETHGSAASEWEKVRSTELTLLETFKFLKSCHRRAPFLFFNGNTFAEIGRALANALFSDLSFHRKKEAASVVAHFVTGVLEEELMIAALDSFSRIAELKAGDQVKTLRGSTHGVVIRIMKDGRVLWRPNGSQSELIAMADGLLRV
jgi:hypothetical protein